MTTAHKLRRFAESCRELARSAGSSHSGAELRRIAAKYDRDAVLIERSLGVEADDPFDNGRPLSEAPPASIR